MSAAGRVLVVDDQEDVRETTRLALAGAGYAVTTAPSGRDALRLARSNPFDLVLLDVNMPGLDGWATLRLLRADGDLARLPVAMFTVKSEVRDKVTGLQDGAIDYITKPFAVDDLVARVARILGASGRPSRSVPGASGS